MEKEKNAKILILPEQKIARKKTWLNAFFYAGGLMLFLLFLLSLFFPKFFLLLAWGSFVKFFAAKTAVSFFFWKTLAALLGMFFLAASSYAAFVFAELKRKGVGVMLDEKGITSFFGNAKLFATWESFQAIGLTTNPWRIKFSKGKKIWVFDVFDLAKLQQRIDLYRKETFNNSTIDSKELRLVAAALIKRKDGKIFIAKRKAGGNAGGKWEFPGGKLEEGETPEQCLERELKEELNIDAKAGKFFAETFFNYEHGSFRILAYEVTDFKGRFELNEHDDSFWVLPEEMQKFDFVQGDLPIIDKLLKELAA